MTNSDVWIILIGMMKVERHNSIDMIIFSDAFVNSIVVAGAFGALII